MTGEKALPRSPLLLGGGVRGGGEKYGHNLFIINGLILVKPCFISSPVAALPSSLPPRASPPLTPPPRRRGLQIDSFLHYDTPSRGCVFSLIIPFCSPSAKITKKNGSASLTPALPPSLLFRNSNSRNLITSSE